jgi:hypothetical protein
MKNLKYFIALILIYVFYRVKWMHHEESGETGYFLLKREWVWFIILPLNIIYVFVRSVIVAIADIFNYDFVWISSQKKEKLSFLQKLDMGYRLFN